MSIRVLVIGNSRANTDLARSVLSPLDCEVSPATSISLGLFLAHKTLPDLILSSHEMVDGNGLDLLREVKADEELRNIPFVFVGAGQDADLQQAGLALGADKFISRPVSSEQFLQAVRPYLRERKQSRPEESPE